MSDPSPGPRWRRADVLAGASLLGLALAAWLAARALPVGSLRQPGPGLFPKGLTVLLAALSLVLLARGWRRPGADPGTWWEDRAGARRVLVMTAALLGYVGMVETAGYLLSTAALFIVMVRWVGGRGWATALGAGLLAALGSYLLFARALRVTLPAGPWLP